ncbi:MAG TPA: hypothetical protein PLL78_00380 [Fimbriimonadaceae bacterium]|nr:hypothetical protein [Fimbriimonadaceae bacterium]HRJ95117.1 hypothetical protein [Fimbriimonadaceae bacterium]
MNDPLRYVRRVIEIEGGRRLYVYEFEPLDPETEREPPSESDEGIP